MDFGAEMAKPRYQPEMGGKGFSHLSNIGVRIGNSKVIYIGVREEVLGLEECGGKEVR